MKPIPHYRCFSQTVLPDELWHAPPETDQRTMHEGAEQFVFFWSNNSPFSQWHKSDFQAPALLFTQQSATEHVAHLEETLINFSSAEQFMMYHKAILFGDLAIAQRIMQTNNVRKIKDLGRKVSRFEEHAWRYFRTAIVLAGNHAKFTQNPKLLATLLATEGKTIVEASPYDRIWGIGLLEDDPRAQQRETWQGLNLLGEVLTALRLELQKSKPL